MKKIILPIVACFLVMNASACDICGCGGGNNYIGILPDFYKHIVGIRYRSNALVTHIGVGGASTYLTTSETYSNAEMWGGWNLTNNFRIMVTVPVSFNTRINNTENKSKQGLGDVSLAGYYQVLNKKNTVCKDKLLVQSLWLGAGIKLPTGQYDPADKTNTAQNTNLFQLGTASVDYLLSMMYDIRLMDAGLNVSANYKTNTSNRYQYQYGNKFTLSSQLYYKIKVGKITLAPNTGLQYETGNKDLDQGFTVDLSGGNALMATFGTEFNFNKIAFGANWQTPLSQQLAGGFVKAGNRMMLHMAVAL